MPGWAFACAAKSWGGSYRRSSSRIVSMACAWVWTLSAISLPRRPRERASTPEAEPVAGPQGPPDRNDRPVFVHRSQHQRRRGIPGDGGGDDSGPAAGTDPTDLGTRRRDAARGGDPEADGEQDLGDLERQEDAEDRQVDAQAPEHHVRVEDGEREQEPRKRVRDVAALQRAAQLRRLDEDDEDAEREPEAPVRR